MSISEATTTQARADAWQTAMPLLTAMFEELKDFGKKKPDAVVSKSKIALVNRVLEACRMVLDGQPSLVFLDLLNADDVPQMSDAVLMLSQYVAAMKSFNDKYYYWDGSRHRWRVSKTS